MCELNTIRVLQCLDNCIFFSFALWVKIEILFSENIWKTLSRLYLEYSSYPKKKKIAKEKKTQNTRQLEKVLACSEIEKRSHLHILTLEETIKKINQGLYKLHHHLHKLLLLEIINQSTTPQSQTMWNPLHNTSE